MDRPIPPETATRHSDSLRQSSLVSKALGLPVPFHVLPSIPSAELAQSERRVSVSCMLEVSTLHGRRLSPSFAFASLNSS